MEVGKREKVTAHICHESRMVLVGRDHQGRTEGTGELGIKQNKI